MGKGEIARNEQFLLFPQCFLLVLENFLPFSSNLKLSSASPFSVEESKICCLGKCELYFSAKSALKVFIPQLAEYWKEAESKTQNIDLSVSKNLS